MNEIAACAAFTWVIGLFCCKNSAQRHFAAACKLVCSYLLRYSASKPWLRSASCALWLMCSTAVHAGFPEGVAALEVRDYATALHEFETAAQLGGKAAQFNLGLMYARGEGVAADDAQAAVWFAKAADQGLAQAQFNLGMMYAHGKGVAQDKKKAVL
jgi:TPR repeat protein